VLHKDSQNTAFEYDPALDTWRILAPLKAGRGSVGVVALDGKIHAIGGRPDGTTVATHEVYDPATSTWKELAPLPRARDHVAAAVADGKIHVAAGVSGRRPSAPTCTTSMIPRPTAGSRVRPADPRSGLAGTFYKGLFMVLGGELPPTTTFAENEGYDAKAGSWRTLAPMPGGRHATAAATDGERVYLAGGSLKPGSGEVTNQLIVFTLP
jgi:N-acetylneuraminic acid mutarotase